MSILNRFLTLWAPSATGTARLGEAARSTGLAVGLDEDDGFRRLTGDADRDLSPISHARMRKVAAHLWRTNLIANRLIELPLAFLLAEGVQVQVADPRAQAWVEAFWNDPINNFEVKLPKKVRELAIFGEQCYPAFVNEVSGHLRLGYLDPGSIETVICDPENPEQPIGIVTARDAAGRARRYQVIVNGPEEVFGPRARAIRESLTDGECFYFKINDLSGGTRGNSDLLAQADWLDTYDQYLFGEIERWNFLRAFMWDVTLKGATPEEVRARAREISPPAPGSVRIHNEAEEWRAETPELQQAESAEGARLFRNHVLGGASVPEHWYGGGGNVNKATLGDDPVIDGYIDRLTIAYDGDGHDVRLEGRDRVGDLVDCSAVHSPDEWHEIGLPELVSILGEPFNVAVTAEPGLDLGRPFARFKVQQGESAFEAVERACRQRAVLPTSDGKGRLLLTRAGRHDMGTLSLGHDIISANAKFSDRKRYSRYIVKGQRPANDRFNGPVATAAVATAEDPNIRRDRPLLLLAEEPGDAEILAQRAKWEATIRAGRARSVAVTLRDWRRDGRLWAPGASVAYSDPFMGLTEAARMIVAKVEFTISDKTGPRTRLELRSEAAFVPNPLPDLIDQEPGG